MSILEYFPYPTIRPSQQLVLEWVEKNWNRFDLFVLQAPVAAGKSAIAVTISRWANSVHGHLCGITTPDNVLVNQYVRDHKLWTLPYARSFATRELFNAARRDFKGAPLKVMNNYTLLANKVYSPVQIMDEAHQLIPMLQDDDGRTVWQHIDHYDDNIKSGAQVLMWAASQGADHKLAKKITKLLSKNPDNYVIVHGKDMYRGRIRKNMRIYPLTPKNNAPILWPPSKVKKLILMSATIAQPDIEDLGLHNRRVGYIEVPSDIPVDNRPFKYTGVGSMGREQATDTLPAMLEKIKQLHNKHGGRGMLHTTYGLSARIQAMGDFPALIFHNNTDKRDKLNAWLYDKSDRRTFVGCGLTTGIDLKYDMCNWQAIMKCQFADLGDPAVAAKAERNPSWYSWNTIKSIIQAYGRVCRAPDDKGITYMLDSDFTRLYNDYSHQMPNWFKESIDLGI